MNLIDLSIKRPLFVTMITLFLVVVGLLALRKLPIDLYPDVSPPVLTVRVGFPGASPEEVEELVVKRLEDVLSTIGGIKAMRSASRESMGFVSLEFEAGRDIRQEGEVHRCGWSVQDRHAEGDRGAGLVAESRALRGRSTGRGSR